MSKAQEFKVGDKVVFHNARSVPQWKHYDGVLGTVTQADDPNFAYPYTVDLSNGTKLAFVAQDELTLAAEPQPFNIKPELPWTTVSVIVRTGEFVELLSFHGGSVAGQLTRATEQAQVLAMIDGLEIRIETHWPEED